MSVPSEHTCFDDVLHSQVGERPVSTGIESDKVRYILYSKMRRAHLVGENSMHPTSEMLEAENQNLEDSLGDKVKALKSLSIDIGTEVRDQNKYLSQMDDDFDSSGGLLGSTMRRVQAMAKAGHNRYIFYLIMFALSVFFVCWIILKMR